MKDKDSKVHELKDKIKNKSDNEKLRLIWNWAKTNHIKLRQFRDLVEVKK
jgi:hypothetical protein